MDQLSTKQYEAALKVKDLYKNFTEKADLLKTKGAANIHLTRLQVYYENFFADHKKILKLKADNEEHPYFASNIEQEVEDGYWDNRGLFTDFIMNIESNEKALEKSLIMPDNSISVQAPISHRHLPKIEIPTFSGEYVDWENFRDTFRSIVHSNESISVVDKFHYLRTYVTGKALTLIHRYNITAANYSLAWDALKNYYENKRRIVQAHLTNLFAIKPMKSQSAEAINLLIIGIFNPIEALSELQRPTEHWDDLVVFIAVSRFELNELSEKPHASSKSSPYKAAYKAH